MRGVHIEHLYVTWMSGPPQAPLTLQLSICKQLLCSYCCLYLSVDSVPHAQMPYIV